MKVRRHATDDIVTIARIVTLSPEEHEEDEPFIEEEGLKAGTYALDGDGRVWRLEETVTGLFQEFMDAKVRRK